MLILPRGRIFAGDQHIGRDGGPSRLPWLLIKFDSINEGRGASVDLVFSVLSLSDLFFLFLEDAFELAFTLLLPLFFSDFPSDGGCFRLFRPNALAD